MLRSINNTLRNAIRAVRPKYAKRRKRLKSMAPEEVFTDIFEKQHWGKDISVSGLGSTPDATKLIAQQLPAVLKQLDIKVFLDAPCGDFSWMKDVELGVERYIGGDIVKALVDQNTASYAGPGREFMVLNLLSDTLPECDMLFCRDCMLHLSYANQRELLENVKKSQAKYVMLSNFPKAEANRDIVTGEARQVNLLLSPIKLPEPILRVNDSNAREPNREMCVWEIEQLRGWNWAG